MVECGRLEAEEMIRTLDANYLSTFDLPPSTWFGRQASVLRVLLEIGGGLRVMDSTEYL